MGELRYDGQSIRFDDETLIHLMMATTARLRRNEPFLLSWHEGPSGEEARRAVWLSASALLSWSLDGPDPAIDRERVERMIMTAGSSAGLHLSSPALLLGAA